MSVNEKTIKRYFSSDHGDTDFLACGISGSAETVPPAEEPATADIIVHKVVNPGYEIENDGQIVSGLTAIKGVTFEIWNITTSTPVKVGEGVTRADGTVTFAELPKIQEVDKEFVYAKYQIRETAAPEYVTDRAANVDIQFPVFEYVNEAFTNDELDSIHIYPKNIVFGGAPEFTKYQRVGNAGEEEPLLGATFKLYRLVNNEKKYLQKLAENETPEYITWDTTNDEDETFTSDANGLVSVEDKNANYQLPAGTYYFEETATGSDEFAVPSEYVISVAIGKDNNGEATFTYTVADAYASNVEGEEKDDARVVNQSANITKVKTSPAVAFQYGNEIGYKITVDVPKNIDKDYSKFYVTDSADDSLVFNASSVQIASNGGTVGLVAKTDDSTALYDYILTPNATYPNFKIDFDISSEPGLQLSDNVKALAGSSLEITYQMSIKEGSSPDTEFENTATLYLTPAEKTTPPISVETYGAKFKKVDGANSAIALQGAKFAVKDSAGNYLTLVDGKYEFKTLSGVTADNAASNNVVLLTSGNDGLFEIKGLVAGDYTLEELVAPTDYAKLLNDVAFEVVKDGYNDTTALKTVANTHKGRLPSTGGTGIVAFVLIGVVALGGAALYFTKGRRQIEG